jgi:hypothetical protein
MSRSPSDASLTKESDVSILKESGASFAFCGNMVDVHGLLTVEVLEAALRLLRDGKNYEIGVIEGSEMSADEPSAPQIPDKPCPHNTPVAHKADGKVVRAWCQDCGVDITSDYV